MTTLTPKSAATLELAHRGPEGGTVTQLAEGAPVPPRPGVEIGSTGLQVFGGIIGGDLLDHSREWQPPTLYQTVDLMRRGDATCAATGLAITLPILATDTRITSRAPDGTKPDAVVEEAARLIEETLFGDLMSRSWDQWLREAVNLYMAYGHYLFEIVTQQIDTGSEFKGAFTLEKLAARHPRTIDQWVFDDHANLTGVKQRVYPTSEKGGNEELKDIPIDKLIVLTNSEEAGSPLGQSIYRPGYKHWMYKDGFYAVHAIAVERQGAGIPFAKYPRGTPPSHQDEAEEMLQSFAAHEQAYFMFEDDWEVGMTDMGASQILDPMRGIEHHDFMIPKSILAGFLNLAQDGSGSGSYALSDDQSGFFSYSLQYAADYIASILNTQLIPQLLDYNYKDLPYYPKLRFDRIGDISLDRLITGIAKLADAGLLTADLKTENRIRDLMNLDPIEEADFEEAQEEAADGQPPPVEGDGDDQEVDTDD